MVDGNYICNIHNVQFQKDQAIRITGDHHPGKTDSDVSSVIFIESKLHGIPREIFSQFENLRVLSVEATGLDELNHLENCGSLESFKAAFNNIVKITDDTFKDCKNLRTVDLQSNKIRVLRKDVFKHNEKLREVNLRSNEIEKIEPCGFLGNHRELQNVDLIGNLCVHKKVHVARDLERFLGNCYISWYLSGKYVQNY